MGRLTGMGLGTAVNLFFYRRLGPPIDVTSLGPIWLLEVERRAQIVRWVTAGWI